MGRPPSPKEKAGVPHSCAFFAQEWDSTDAFGWGFGLSESEKDGEPGARRVCSRGPGEKN